MELESVHAREDIPTPAPTSTKHSAADLELAVLVQELCGMREERADLRARVYLLQKEKAGLELTTEHQREVERVLRTKAEHLQVQNR